MSKKESFVFYTSVWPQLFKMLENDEERGQLIMVIIDYVSFGTLPSGNHSRAFLGAFEIMKEQLDKDADKYQKTVEKKREAGKLGWQASAKQMASRCQADAKQMPSNAKQSQANQAVNVNVNDNVNDNVNVNEITTTTHAKPTDLDILAYFDTLIIGEKAKIQAWRFRNYNDERGWDCLPDWQTAAQRWIEKI